MDAHESSFKTGCSLTASWNWLVTQFGEKCSANRISSWEWMSYAHLMPNNSGKKWQHRMKCVQQRLPWTNCVINMVSSRLFACQMYSDSNQFNVDFTYRVTSGLRNSRARYCAFTQKLRRKIFAHHIPSSFSPIFSMAKIIEMTHKNAKCNIIG